MDGQSMAYTARAVCHLHYEEGSSFSSSLGEKKKGNTLIRTIISSAMLEGKSSATRSLRFKPQINASKTACTPINLANE